MNQSDQNRCILVKIRLYRVAESKCSRDAFRDQLHELSGQTIYLSSCGVFVFSLLPFCLCLLLLRLATFFKVHIVVP